MSDEVWVFGHRAAILFPDIDRLTPGSYGLVTTSIDANQSFRVIAARVGADYPQSWFLRLVRRLPGGKRLLRRRDAAVRVRATAQTRIDHVAVDNFATLPDKCAELPMVIAGGEISVRVTNTGDRPLVVRVLVEGVLS